MGSYDRGRIWVGDLLPECEDQDLLAYFGKFGQVREATVQREKRTKLSRGFGFLKMGSQMLVDKVLKENHQIWENAITVKLASDVTIEPEPVPEGSEKADTEGRGEKRAAADEGEKEPGKFFISALAAETTEEAVREYFEAFGDITEVSIVKDAQGKSKNYGFVIMADPSKDDEIASAEHEVNGKTIEVKKCAKKTVKRAKGDGREAPAPTPSRVGIAGPRDKGRGGKGDAGDPGKGDGKRGVAPSSRGGHAGWEDSKGSRGGSWEDSKGRDSKGSRGGGYEDSKGSKGHDYGGKGHDYGGKGKDYGSKGHDYGGKSRGGYGDEKGRGGYGDDRRGKDSKGGRDDGGKGKGKDDGKGKHRNPYEGYGGPSGYGARPGGDDRKGGKGKGGW